MVKKSWHKEIPCIWRYDFWIWSRIHGDEKMQHPLFTWKGKTLWKRKQDKKYERGIMPCRKKKSPEKKSGESINTLETWYRVTKDNIPGDEQSQDLRILAQPNITYCIFLFLFHLLYPFLTSCKVKVVLNQSNITKDVHLICTNYDFEERSCCTFSQPNVAVCTFSFPLSPHINSFQW